MRIEEQILIACSNALTKIDNPKDRLDALTTIVKQARDLTQDVYDNYPMDSYDFHVNCGIAKKVIWEGIEDE